jgi:hypothetical protein
VHRSFWRENWFGIGILSLMGCFTLFLFFPVHQDKQASVKTQCLSNIKQTSTATALYLSDNDDRMPLANWMTSLMAYIKDRELMQCPQVKRDGKHFGYALKLGAVGMNTLEVKDHDKTVMYFETDALGESVVANLAARCARHRPDGSNVSFLDTHARFVKLDAPLK